MPLIARLSSVATPVEIPRLPMLCRLSHHWEEVAETETAEANLYLVTECCTRCGTTRQIERDAWDQMSGI